MSFGQNIQNQGYIHLPALLPEVQIKGSSLQYRFDFVFHHQAGAWADSSPYLSFRDSPQSPRGSPAGPCWEADVASLLRADTPYEMVGAAASLSLSFPFLLKN